MWKSLNRMNWFHCYFLQVQNMNDWTMIGYLSIAAKGQNQDGSWNHQQVWVRKDRNVIFCKYIFLERKWTSSLVWFDLQTIWLAGMRFAQNAAEGRVRGWSDKRKDLCNIQTLDSELLFHHRKGVEICHLLWIWRSVKGTESEAGSWISSRPRSIVYSWCCKSSFCWKILHKLLTAKPWLAK